MISRQQGLKCGGETFPMSNDAQAGKDQKTAITPMLSVRNGKRAIEFYKKAVERLVVLRV